MKTLPVRKSNNEKTLWKSIWKNWELYLLLALPVIYLIIFKYIPMYGVQIAFRDFRAANGILNSPWVGFKHFKNFFENYMFLRVIKNTFAISIYSLLAGFPIPIILAFLINYMPSPRFKKAVQTLTYAPHFISVVVICGMAIMFLGERSGLINNIISLFGMDRKDFMSNPSLFSSIYVWSGIWQGMGYSSIIYISVLAGVDTQLYEASIVDGASIMKRIIHIDFPHILPTVIILLILHCGQLLNVGFEKVLLLQNPLNGSTSEIISTYVYKIGIINPLGDYSYAAAIGLFTSVINLIMLITVNSIASKVGETSL